MEDEFEIYIEDLKPEVHKRLLKFLKFKTPEEGNLDVLPIATIPKPEGEV